MQLIFDKYIDVAHQTTLYGSDPPCTKLKTMVISRFISTFRTILPCE